MSYARVQVQAASWYLPDDTVRRRDYVSFSVMELHVGFDFTEPKRL